MSISKVKLKSGIHYQAVVWRSGIRLGSKTFGARTQAINWLSSRECKGPIANMNGLRKMTLAEYWTRYHISELRVKPSTRKDYLSIWNSHLEPRFGHYNLDSLEFENFDAKFGEWIDGGMSPSRANRIRAVLSGILTRIEKVGVFQNPLKNAKWFREDLRLRKFWSVSEACAFLNWVKQNHPRWHLFYLAAYETGLRFSELVALKWDAVDLISRQAVVTRIYCSKSSQFLESTKGGVQRVIQLSDSLAKELSELHSSRHSELVFEMPSGGVVRYFSVRRRFRRWQELARVKVITFHGIRHTFASHFLQAGGSLFQLKRILGHTDFETTLRYSHYCDDSMRTAANLVSQQLSRPSSGISA